MDRNTWTFIAVFTVLAIAAGFIAVNWGFAPSDIAVIGFLAFTIIILAFAAVVLWQIISGKISLNGLVGEAEDIKGSDGKAKASLSRFQFLIFTFVVAGLFLMLSIETGSLVNIPANVLALIGISGGSYVVSKAIGKKDKKQGSGE